MLNLKIILIIYLISSVVSIEKVSSQNELPLRNTLTDNEVRENLFSDKKGTAERALERRNNDTSKVSVGSQKISKNKTNDSPNTWGPIKVGTTSKKLFNPIVGDFQTNLERAKKVAKEITLDDDNEVPNSGFYKGSNKNGALRFRQKSPAYISRIDNFSPHTGKSYNFLPLNRETAKISKFNKGTDEVNSGKGDTELIQVDGQLENLVAINDARQKSPLFNKLGQPYHSDVPQTYLTSANHILPITDATKKQNLYHQNQIIVNENGEPIAHNYYNIGGNMPNKLPSVASSNVNDEDFLTTIDGYLGTMKRFPLTHSNTLNPVDKINLHKHIKIIEMLRILAQKGLINRMFEQKILQILGTKKSESDAYANVMQDKQLKVIIDKLFRNLNSGSQNHLQTQILNLKTQSIPGTVNTQHLNLIPNTNAQIINKEKLAFNSKPHQNIAVQDDNEIPVQQNSSPINSGVLAQFVSKQQSENHPSSNHDNMWPSQWINSIDNQNPTEYLQTDKKLISLTPNVQSENYFYVVNAPYLNESAVLRSSSTEASAKKKDSKDRKEAFETNESENSKFVKKLSNRSRHIENLLSVINKLNTEQRDYIIKKNKLPNQKNTWSKTKNNEQPDYSIQHSSTEYMLGKEKDAAADSNLQEYFMDQDSHIMLSPAQEISEERNNSYQNKFQQKIFDIRHPPASSNEQNSSSKYRIQAPYIIHHSKKQFVPIQLNNRQENNDNLSQVLYQKQFNGITNSSKEELLNQHETELSEAPVQSQYLLQNAKDVSLPYKLGQLTSETVDPEILKFLIKQRILLPNNPSLGNILQKKNYIKIQNGKKVLLPIQHILSPEYLKYFTEFNPSDSTATGNNFSPKTLAWPNFNKPNNLFEIKKQQQFYGIPNSNPNNNIPSLYPTNTGNAFLQKNYYILPNGKKVLLQIPQIVSSDSAKYLTEYNPNHKNDDSSNDNLLWPKKPFRPHEPDNVAEIIKKQQIYGYPTNANIEISVPSYQYYYNKTVLLPILQNIGTDNVKIFTDTNPDFQNDDPKNSESFMLQSKLPIKQIKPIDLLEIIKNQQDYGIPNANVQNLLSMYQNNPDNTLFQQKYYMLQNGKKVFLPIQNSPNEQSHVSSTGNNILLKLQNSLGLKKTNSSVEIIKNQTTYGLPIANTQSSVPLYKPKTSDIQQNYYILQNGKKVLLPIQSDISVNNEKVAGLLYKQIYGIQKPLNNQNIQSNQAYNVNNIPVQQTHHLLQNGKSFSLPAQQHISPQSAKYFAELNKKKQSYVTTSTSPNNLLEIIKKEIIYGTTNANIKQSSLPLYQPNAGNITVQQKYYILQNGKKVLLPIQQNIRPESAKYFSEFNLSNENTATASLNPGNMLDAFKQQIIYGSQTDNTQNLPNGGNTKVQQTYFILQNGKKVPVQQNMSLGNTKNVTELLHKQLYGIQNPLNYQNMLSNQASTINNLPSQQYIIYNGQKLLVQPSSIYDQLYAQHMAPNGQIIGSDIVQNSHFLKLINPYLSQYYGYSDFTPTGNLPASFTWPAVTNLNKLNYVPADIGVIEITYIVKRPNPLVFEPFYFVKYRYPVNVFLGNVQNILLRKPYLKKKALDIYNELISYSNIADVSPDLKKYSKQDIMNLFLNNRPYIETKILNNDDKILHDQIKAANELNSKFGFNNILRTLMTINNLNNEKIKDDIKSLSGESVKQNDGVKSFYVTKTPAIKKVNTNDNYRLLNNNVLKTVSTPFPNQFRGQIGKIVPIDNRNMPFNPRLNLVSQQTITSVPNAVKSQITSKPIGLRYGASAMYPGYSDLNSNKLFSFLGDVYGGEGYASNQINHGKIRGVINSHPVAGNPFDFQPTNKQITRKNPYINKKYPFIKQHDSYINQQHYINLQNQNPYKNQLNSYILQRPYINQQDSYLNQQDRFINLQEPYYINRKDSYINLSSSHPQNPTINQQGN